MSILAWIEDQKRLKLLNAPKYVNPASDSSKGLWTRCDKCGVILYIKHLKENQRVCFGCSYHLQMSSQERVENLLDKDSWRPLDETVSPCDPLEFHDQKDYTDRLQEAQERTGLQDAIQTGSGLVDGIPIALGVMDFDFMGGSMGSVVGEKVTRLIEYATQEGLTLVLVCASGGARMQEGVFSLMQMAKISSALQVYQACANLLYISILTSPTTGGVTASFAMLGDIIFAEPKALVAFAGRRVIEQTLCEDLPEDFQTSEYMLHHGLLDLIVPRRFFRQALSESIRLYKNAPFKKPGRIPFGVQNPITFVVEERLRRQWAFGNAPVADKLSRLWAQSTGKDASSGVESARSSNKNRVEIAPTQVQDKGSSSQLTRSSRNGLNGSTKTASSNYTQGISSTNLSAQSKEGNKLLQDGTVNEARAETGDIKNPTDGLETPSVQMPSSATSSLAQTQDKLLFKNDTQPGVSTPAESAPLDASLPNEDSAQPAAFIAPSELQNCAATVSVGDSFDPLLQREAADYRDILTSFQTMFNLFSKELVVPYASVYAKDIKLDKDENKESLINSGDWNANLPQKVANLSGVETSGPVGRGDSKSDLLLHRFFTLSENQDFTQQAERFHPGRGNAGTQTQIEDVSVDDISNRTKQPQLAKTEIEQPDQTPSSAQIQQDASYPNASSDSVSVSSHSTALEKTASNTPAPTSVASSQATDRLSIYKDVLPSSGTSKELVSSPSIYVDFLNQSIELAATESVEWRAFYLHQRIYQTTGFIEDLAQSLPEYPKHSNEITFQNMLFYRSICRRLS